MDWTELALHLPPTKYFTTVEFTLGWRWIRFSSEHYTFSMRTSFCKIKFPLYVTHKNALIINYVIEHKARNN